MDPLFIKKYYKKIHAAAGFFLKKYPEKAAIPGSTRGSTYFKILYSAVE
jgi:hypothetical protein